MGVAELGVVQLAVGSWQLMAEKAVVSLVGESLVGVLFPVVVAD